MSKAISNIITVIAYAFAMLAATVVIAAAAMYVYDHTTDPIPVEVERVQPVNNVNICREVESGALDARTVNSCPPKFNYELPFQGSHNTPDVLLAKKAVSLLTELPLIDTEPVKLFGGLQPFGSTYEDEVTAQSELQPTMLDNELQKQNNYRSIQ